MSNLTSDQVDAVTYAHMDICATDTFLNGDDPLDRRAWDEIANAVTQTKVDLEKAFPFLLEGVDDE